MEGTRGFHQVKSVFVDKISLYVRNLSCYCKFCSNGGDGPCDNEIYFAPFTFIYLEPCNLGGAQANVDSILELEMDRKALTTTLEVGDHFEIIAEEIIKDQIFGVSFEKNHYMLWKRKGKLIIGGKWCFKENKLSLEDIINNISCHSA